MCYWFNLLIPLLSGVEAPPRSITEKLVSQPSSRGYQQEGVPMHYNSAHRKFRANVTMAEKTVVNKE